MRKTIAFIISLLIPFPAPRRKIRKFLRGDQKTAVLTNLFFRHLTGSELATLDAAKYFLSRGYKVYIFCFEKKNGPLMDVLPRGIEVIDILAEPIPEISADVVWANHWAILTKLLSHENFKAKKIVHLSLSMYLDEEREPKYAEKLSKLLANSWENAQIRSAENSKLKIEVFNNAVTPDFFMSVKIPLQRLKKLAVVSNNGALCPGGDFDAELRRRGIEPTFFAGFGMESKIITPAELLTFDAVLTIGRTVQYCMAMGIPVFCYDRFGGPGYINLKNWRDCEKMNYSGRKRLYGKDEVDSIILASHDAKKIADDLVGGYAEALRDLPKLRRIARRRYDLFRNIGHTLRGLPNAKIARDDVEMEIAAADEYASAYFPHGEKLLIRANSGAGACGK
jgi:hypothetical protein